MLLCFVVASQWLHAQGLYHYSSNPFSQKFEQTRIYGYQQAKTDLKAGKPVKGLALYDYGKNWADSLEQFVELEKLSIFLSKKDTIELTAAFEQLSRLPTLKYLTITHSWYTGTKEEMLRIPQNFGKLNQLEGLSIRTGNPADLRAVWAAFPKFNNLVALELESLSGQSDFPEAIRFCKKLQYLSATLPVKMTLPAWLGELKSLEYVIIRSGFSGGWIPKQSLAALKEILPSLTALKMLEIKHYVIKGADLKALSETLQSLSIESCAVSESDELTAALNRCKKLESIEFKNNILAPFASMIKVELPALKMLNFSNLYEDSLRKKPLRVTMDFSTSTQLKELYLIGILGETLPKGIEQMIHLEELNLSKNSLTQLPDTEKLTKLKSLTSYNNQLIELPKSLGKLLDLRVLNVADNQLKELPEGIANASKLHTLRLYNNKLVELPSKLAKLNQLQELSVSGNQLAVLPKNLGELQSLKTLSVFNNSLKELPNSIGQLKSLVVLHASHNPITKLPETLGDCDSLRNLLLANCQLETLPASIGKLKLLAYLMFGDGDFIFSERVNGNDDFNNMPAKNHNQLRSLPVSLAQCRQLTNLDLSRNKYWEEKELWPVIQQLRIQTGTVNLSDCNLDSIPVTGWQDTEIQSLLLSNNQLTQFPVDWFKAKGIRTIALNRNKLTPATMNQHFASFEERLLLGEEMGIDVAKPFPKNKQMARAYLNLANKKINTGDVPRFVEYMKQVQQIDSTEAKYATELWARFYFHTHQYRRAVDSTTKVVDRYFKFEKMNTQPPNARRGLPVALYVDLRGQSKWKLGDSLGAIKDYELLVEDYKIFSPNLFGRLGVWYKRYRPTAGKSGATFDKAINMYESIQNQPPMVQLSVAEVYFMNDQADKAYEYLFGLEKSKFKPDEKLLADYLLLAAQIAQKQAGEEEMEAFEKRLKSQELKVRNWSYQLFEEALGSLEYPKEQKVLISRLTNAMKSQSVLVD